MVIDLLKSGFFVAFFCSVAYIIGYSILAPWWKNPWGRGMVSFSAASQLLLLPTLLHITFGINFSSGFAAWYYIVSLYLDGLIEVYRLRWAYRIQQHDTPRGRRQNEVNRVRADHDESDPLNR